MIATGLLTSGALAAPSDYLLRPGDEVEVSIAGAPDARQRTTIGVDGMAAIPYAGYVRADGLTLPEFRTMVQNALADRNIRKTGPTGQEIVSPIDRDEIGVSIFGYRPIYLSGDIAKGGEQRYRPGMSVKQAIALAGGFDIMRVRMDNPFLGVLDQKATYENLRSELAAEGVRAARLQAEFDKLPEFTGKGLSPNVDPELARQIVALEVDQFANRRDDLRKERESLNRRLQLGRKQLADLTEQEQKEREGVQADTAEFNRNADLLNRGTVLAIRVTDARRALLLSSTRLLQTTVTIAATQREVEDVNRKVERLDDERHLAVAKELQATRLKIDNLRSKIAASGDKLVYTGMVKSQLVRDNANEADITVTRQGPEGPTRIKATDDTALEPGDIVDVSLQSTYFRDAASGPAQTPAAPANAAPAAAPRKGSSSDARPSQGAPIASANR